MTRQRKPAACEISEATCNGAGCPARAVISVEWLAESLNGKPLKDLLALKVRLIARKCPKVVIDYLDLLIETHRAKRVRRQKRATKK
jgi:hypothetical protein